MTLKILDLFSGIGGFSLGLEATGHFETKAFCEIEPYCQQVLKKNFPGVPIFDDIRTLKGTDIGAIDIITGGYPCQPFSVAGKQKAEQDPRHLWPEYFRLIQELKPTWVIGENVSGHIKLGLDSVLEDLESEGYSTRTFSISASSIGANHKRERVWTLDCGLDSGHLKRPQQIQVRLQDQVREPRLWPTPTTEVANRTTKYKQGGTPLTLAVRMWPTPRVNGEENLDTLIKRKGVQKAVQHNLKAAVQMWPTPTANEDACGKPTGKMQRMLGNHPEVRKPLDGGTLNPEWVEWLMGFPRGWTDLNHSETQ
jgi:DNA (cytosine-5)-methyltransferase 1